MNDELEMVSKSLGNAENQSITLNEEEATLGWPPTPYTQVKDLQKQLDPYIKLWETAAQYNSKLVLIIVVLILFSSDFNLLLLFHNQGIMLGTEALFSNWMPKK
jgi:hypothetical protein